MKYLVIVESPSKCQKIAKYLNDNDDVNLYEVVATMGHITELRTLSNIDFSNNFTCKYDLVESKKKNTEAIRKKIKTVDEVILACDDDREGMGINFSVCQTFNLDAEKTKRIIFNEITETAIVNAIKHPTTINMNVVYAQRARQILDLVVGFKVSPMLWKFIARNKDNALSAGRCQTPALRLIYDNQMEINSAKKMIAYNTTGIFTNSNLPFELNKQFDSASEVEDFLDESSRHNHVYSCSKPTKVYKSQPEPFTTSRIQQVSSNELHYSPKDTMRICQTLYEGGYITYMRTDSKTYSRDFVNAAKVYITKTFPDGEKYINDNIDGLILGGQTVPIESVSVSKKPKQPKQPKQTTQTTQTTQTKQTTQPKQPKQTKSGVAPQEAHEAIRPTDVTLRELPEKIDSSIFGQKERRLYKLIWENTLESCMKPASYFSVTAQISAAKDTTFCYTSELIDFLGWKIVSKKPLAENKEYTYLQSLKPNASIQYKKMACRATLKGGKLHYTEAKLVQLLEERGIGRPSTFSSIVDKIQERGYVKKADITGTTVLCYDYELENDEITELEIKRDFGNEKGKMVIQPLGILVVEFLDKHFKELFDYDYTSQMEAFLDKIATGEMEPWYKVCESCDKQIESLIGGLSSESKLTFKIDERNTYMIGKYGPVIKCDETINGVETVVFKPVKKDIDLDKLKTGTYSISEMVDSEKLKEKKISEYPLGKFNGEDVILKRGKFGIYVTWGENSKTIKEFGNRPLENITFEEVRPFLERGAPFVRTIDPNLALRNGPKGDYIFYKTVKMKKPAFYSLTGFGRDTEGEDYKICDLAILKSWISEKYGIH